MLLDWNDYRTTAFASVFIIHGMNIDFTWQHSWNFGVGNPFVYVLLLMVNE